MHGESEVIPAARLENKIINKLDISKQGIDVLCSRKSGIANVPETIISLLPHMLMALHTWLNKITAMCALFDSVGKAQDAKCE
jgi:hypothetical protein